MTARRRHDYGADAPWSVAITIPARDEADRIVTCLDAAARSLNRHGGIVVAVNGSRDDTFARAQAWFDATGACGVLLDDPAPPRGGNVGHARRQAVGACAARLSADGAVMTTDADSRVAPDWVVANLVELRQADLICGTVLPDAGEYARLPGRIAERGAIEGEYVALTMAVQQLLDPVAHDPEPAHLNAAGASLAFPLALYRDVGGIPDQPTAEDRAFAARAEARGWRVRHSALARVTTSCRMDGRAPGGMAGMLSARVTEADPLVDEALEPAEPTILRAALRGALRRTLADRAAFATAWAAVEEQTPALKRERMRLSEVQRELPRLAAALARHAQQPERQIA